MRRKRAIFFAANVLGGIVLVLLLIDPDRPLLPIFLLLGLAVALAFVPSLLPPRS